MAKVRAWEGVTHSEEFAMNLSSAIEHYFILFVLFAFLVMLAIAPLRPVVWCLLPSVRLPLSFERHLRNAHRMKHLKK